MSQAAVTSLSMLGCEAPACSQLSAVLVLRRMAGLQSPQAGLPPRPRQSLDGQPPRALPSQPQAPPPAYQRWPSEGGRGSPAAAPAAADAGAGVGQLPAAGVGEQPAPRARRPTREQPTQTPPQPLAAAVPVGRHGVQQQPAAGGPELTLGQLRPVAPSLQHVAAQEQQQPESPAKPLLHHSEFVAPQVSNGHLVGPSALRDVELLTLTAEASLLHRDSRQRLMHHLRAYSAATQLASVPAGAADQPRSIMCKEVKHVCV